MYRKQLLRNVYSCFTGYCPVQRYTRPVILLLFLIVFQLLPYGTFNIGLYAGFSGDATAFSGSYSTRARATQANYWNPANLIYPPDTKGEFLLFNSFLELSNNAFTIRRYNDLNGRYLSDYEKDNMLDNVGDELILNAGFTHSLGLAAGNYAVTGRFNVFGKGRLSSDYIRLLLYGNEYGKAYSFDSDNNSVDILVYTDLTYGQSLYSFDLFGQTFHTGAAISLLAGHFMMDTDEYKSNFKVTDDGIYYDQHIAVRTGKGGMGLKSLVGLRNDFNENMSFSLAVDNAFGFIHWMGDNEVTDYEALVDNAYFSHLKDDIIITSDSTQAISSFTSWLHPSFRLGAQYDENDFSFSVDWKQGFTNSVLTSKTPEIGMGLEYRKIRSFPLRMGYKPGISGNPYSVSYGVALYTKELALSVGVESVRAIIPSSYSEGISIAVTSKWSF